MRLHDVMRPALLVFVAFAPWCAGETVVRVKDGDSLVVDSNGREVEVRLADIDTPEFNQPGVRKPRRRSGRWSPARMFAWNWSGAMPTDASWPMCSWGTSM